MRVQLNHCPAGAIGRIWFAMPPDGRSLRRLGADIVLASGLDRSPGTVSQDSTFWSPGRTTTSSLNLVETAISLLVLVLLLGLLVALVRRMRTTRRVTVLEDHVLGGHAVEIEPALVSVLSSLRGVQYEGVPGQHAVVLRRIPVWAIVPVFLLFPVGLVFLLVRESIRLDVRLFDGPNGAVARLSGNTESVVLERVRGAVAGLSQSEPARP
jgi:hypothetical protein